MVQAVVTGEMINWAITRSHETPHSLAEKLGIKPEKLSAWERGDSHPSFRQAQALAKKLRIPFGYLFLNTPPLEDLPLPDLRTKPGAASLKPSPDFLDILYDALRKQEWYREYLQQEDTSPVAFIGKFNIDDDIKTVATDISETLGIDSDLRQKCNSWEQFLTELIRRAEQARVLVLRSGIVGSNTRRKLDIEEFRGFAISDNLAPLVFINGSDYKTAQIFTLVHELAHLWIGQSGISNPDYKLRSKQQHNQVDQICDSIAAEVLVPSEEFRLTWNYSQKLDDNLSNISRQYRVSKFVILRRAYEFEKIERAVFLRKYQDLLQESARRKTDSGGDFNKLVLSRNSSTFTRTLVIAITESRVLPKEAASLLNIRVSSLRGIERFVLSSGFMHV